MSDDLSQHSASAGGDSSEAADEFISRERLERVVAYLEVQLADLDRREQQVNAGLTSLDRERRELRREAKELEERTADLDDRLTRREQDVEERESANQLLSRQLQQDREQFTRDAVEFQAEREALRAEQASWREDCERELAELREELEQRETQLNRRTVDLEKRARFHEEHLEKVRSELERQTRELDADVQRQRLLREQTEEQVRRRLNQMATVRELLDQRDQTTRQQRDALRIAAQAEARAAAEHLELRALERQQLDEQHAARLADLEQEAGRLRAREINLEQRETRLETAREELQELQHESAASRAAAEVAWNELCQAVGSQDAQARLDEQRRRLDEHWEARQQAGSDRLNELRQAIDEFRRERALLQEATEARSERLSRRETMLRELEAAVSRALARLSGQSRVLSELTWSSENEPPAAAVDQAAHSADDPVGDPGIESDAA